MKRIITLAILLQMMTAGFANGNPEKLFSQANDLYKNGNFEQSLAVYNQLLSSGYESAALYYNAGNAEFRNGNLGRAILNYERALRLSPSDNDIRNNLEFARSKTTDNINEIPTFFLHDWAMRVINLLSANGWAIACIILMFLACAVWALFFIAKTYGTKKTAFFSALAITLVFIVAIINLCVSNSMADSHDQAIVLSPAVSVKTSPEIDSADKFLLHEGTKVEIDDVINEWSKIRLADGNTGWIENSYIETI